MADLISNQIKLNNETGTACLGSPGEFVGNCVLPKTFVNNIGFGPKPTVSYNGVVVGKVHSYKLQNKRVMLLVKFNQPMGKEYAWCDIKLNTLFSEKVGDNFLLDEIIVENLEILTKILQ